MTLTTQGEINENPNTHIVLSKEENEQLYEKCKSNLISAANKFSSIYPEFDRDEFISEAWVRGINVTNPKYIKNRIRFNILDFLRENKFPRRRKDHVLNEKTTLYDKVFDIEGSLFINLIKSDLERSPQEIIECQDMYDKIISLFDEAGVTEEEKEIFELRYVKEYSIDQIEMITGSNQFFIFNKMTSIKKKLRKVLKTKDITYND